LGHPGEKDTENTRRLQEIEELEKQESF
jgi:hypothetical protein